MKFTRFLKDDRAATAIEYALIVALIALVALGAYQALGTVVIGMWNDIAEKVSAALGSI